MTPNDALTTQEVETVLSRLLEPKLQWSITSLNLVKRILITKETVEVDINLITKDVEKILEFREVLYDELRRFHPREAIIEIGHVNITQEGISGIKRILFVGSGKGGVGKSSVAVNIAASLQANGFQVGIMDADIYGPSVPTMLGITQRPEVLVDEYLLPVEAYGMKTMSVGYLVDEKQALDWRGNIASGTLLQFVQKTFWGELDFLVIDLPPGTGDIQITLAHKLPCDGVLLVTTPQEVVRGDVRRCVDLFAKKGIPVIGAVENMSFYHCEQCGHANTPFPQSRRLVEDDPLERVDCIDCIPLSKDICIAADAGCPIPFQDGMHELKALFTSLSAEIVNRVETLAKELEWQRELGAQKQSQMTTSVSA